MSEHLPSITSENADNSPIKPAVQALSDDDATIMTSQETILPAQSYQIKPGLQDKFKEVPIKEIIREVYRETLTGKKYEAEKVKQWTISIANDVNERVKELQMRRYKHVVQVILGEMKGAGVKSGVRCLWDSDTDGYTNEIFLNDTIFCVTTVFAIYLY